MDYRRKSLKLILSVCISVYRRVRINENSNTEHHSNAVSTYVNPQTKMNWV